MKVSHYLIKAFSKISILRQKGEDMKASNFVKLAVHYQIQYIKMYGKRIMTRQSKKYGYVLFYVDTFFVETAYDLETEIIEYVYPFADYKYLSPYLDEVAINELLK